MTDFYMNLSVLINQRGLSRNKFLKDLGLSKSSMGNWETRNNIPNGETLLKLSEYLHVSIDELLGNKQYMYTKDEQNLIYLYRRLSQEQKNKIYEEVCHRDTLRK